jgi:phytoene dehydrogenase-like protein
MWVLKYSHGRHVVGWAGGNIFHGAMGLNQLFFMRPSSGFARYQTPIPGSHCTPSSLYV